jgi:hypothetical protein
MKMFAPGTDNGGPECAGAESKCQRGNHRRGNKRKDVMGSVHAPKELKRPSPNRAHYDDCSYTPGQRQEERSNGDYEYNEIRELRWIACRHQVKCRIA